MATLWIHPNGDDASKGGPGDPLKTIRRAHELAVPYDVLMLAAANRFDAEPEVKIEKEFLTLRSPSGALPWLQSRLWVARSATAFKCYRVRLDGVSPTSLPSPTINAAGAWFDYCEVTNHHSTIGFSLGHPAYGQAIDTLITRCRIHGIGVLPKGNHHHGIYAGYSLRGRVLDSYIYDCADRGVQLYPDAQGLIVERCVIDDCDIDVIFSSDGAAASNDCFVIDSVLTNAGAYAVSEWSPNAVHGTGNQVLHCLADARHFTSAGHYLIRDVTPISFDPYRNRAKRDYRLADPSLARLYGPARLPVGLA